MSLCQIAFKASIYDSLQRSLGVKMGLEIRGQRKMTGAGVG